MMKITKKSNLSEVNHGTPALKFKQTRKQVTGKGVGMSGVSYPATYDFRAVPDVKKGMDQVYFETVSKFTGTMNEMLGQQLMWQAIHASPGAKEIDIEAEAVVSALGEMKPQDAVEGMIVTQMVSLHNQMMYYMKLSIDEDYRAEEYMSRFLKLNRQFLACLKGLLKYRNRGQQTVVVQNVNVGQEGRAIVGCVQNPPPKEE